MYKKLLKEGEEIFKEIVNDLNRISDKSIRVNKELWRREEDFKEICIALALAKQHIINHVNSL